MPQFYIAIGALYAATILAVQQLPAEPIIMGRPVPEQVIFLGDMMFDRTIRSKTNMHGGDHLFKCIDPILKTASLVVGNLEGPITRNASVSEKSGVGDSTNMTFTFPTSTATLLKKNRVDVVNLGNNHILNFGKDGVAQTKQYLFDAGVEYFGDPLVSVYERVLHRDIGNVHLSFINWNEWTGAATNLTLSLIKNEKASGRIVVVYTHWGDEYSKPPQRVRRLAHLFIDAGADIVIGSHPHVVQESEIYNGKYIYYSLGNFIFDQYWNKEVSRGLIIKVAIGEDGVQKVVEIPVELKRDGTVCAI